MTLSEFKTLAVTQHQVQVGVPLDDLFATRQVPLVEKTDRLRQLDEAMPWKISDEAFTKWLQTPQVAKIAPALEQDGTRRQTSPERGRGKRPRTRCVCDTTPYSAQQRPLAEPNGMIADVAVIVKPD